MHEIVLVLHSWVRWVAIVMGVLATVTAFASPSGAQNNRWARFFTITLDVQFLLGIILLLTLNVFSDFGATMRDPIARFYTYAGQDIDKHGLCDNAPDWLETPRAGSPIEVIAQIVRAYEDGRDWEVVRAILEEKVFRLEDAAPAAAPGACFELAFSPESPASDPEYRSAAPPHALTCASPT
jgi:hypothetical protein